MSPHKILLMIYTSTPLGFSRHSVNTLGAEHFEEERRVDVLMSPILLFPLRVDHDFFLMVSDPNARVSEFVSIS